MRFFVRGVLVLITALLSVAATAQEYSEKQSEFQSLRARITRTITTQDNLPTDCFSDMQIDEVGRMWLVPCAEAQTNRQLNLIQFDGQEGILHDLDFPLNTTVSLNGFIGDSLVVGTELLGSSVWRYNVYSGITRKYRVDNDSVYFYGCEIIDDRIFGLGATASSTHLYELVDSQLLLRSTAPATFFHHSFRSRNFIKESLVSENHLFVVDHIGEVHMFDTETFDHSRVEPAIDHSSDSYILFEWRSEVYVCQQSPPAIFRIADGKMIEESLIPDNWSLLHAPSESALRNLVNSDDSGNLLIRCTDSGGIVHTLLLDAQGRTSDFTSIERAIPESRLGRWTGRDFTKRIFKLGSRLSIVEVGQDNGFTGLKLNSARQMAPIDDHLVLCVTDSNPWILNMEDNSISETKDNPVGEFARSNPELLCADSDGRLWGQSEGVMKQYDPSSGSMSTWQIGTMIKHLSPFRNGVIGFDGSSMLYFSSISSDIDTLSTDLDFDKIGRVNGVVKWDSILLLGSSGGLWYFNTETNSLQASPLNEIVPVHILSIDIAQDGIVFLGTESSGVVIYDMINGLIQIVDRNQGLSHNTVAAVLIDNQGYIWANSFWGLNVISPTGEVIGKFYKEDGLFNNEGNRWSSYKHSDGRLVFGNISGLTVVDLQKALENIEAISPPQIYISQFHYHVKTEGLVTHAYPMPGETYSLSAGIRSLIIHAGISAYETSSLNEFAYRIDRNGYGWTSVGNSPRFTITNLPLGEYDVLIRGRNRSGIWSSNISSVRLAVAKPVYKSWWFYALMSFPLIVFAALWIWRNVRERKRLESEVTLRTQDIRKQAEALKEMDRLKTRIYTNITHEFRTPLTVIKGVADQDSFTAQSRTVLKRNSDRLLNLVNQLLDLSKLESGTLKLNVVSGNIVDLCRDIFDSFTPLAENKDIRLHFFAVPTEIAMDFDIDATFTILGNLVSNAIKFTPEGGDIYLDIRELNSRSEVEILIRDTGIGIATEKLDQVFKRFYQIDGSSSRKGEGTGIGLALTKELVVRLGGRISVESVLDTGADFKVVLPIQNVVSDIAPDQNFTDNLIASGATGAVVAMSDVMNDNSLPTALIVEDNPDVLNYLVACLKGSYNVLLAMDGQEGVEKAVESTPDLIVSDVMMPVMDGLQLCKETKADERSSHIPVILLTAKADRESKIKGLSSGADAYISKPFEKEELMLTLRNVLSARDAMRSRYNRGGLLPPAKNLRISREDVFVQRLNDVVDDNLEDDDFGIMPLSRDMKYSRSQLHNKIKALTGMSASAYIQHRRLYKASNLMQQTEMNISEVAWAVGFKDPKYFSRLFKREFGMNPTDFKDQIEES